MKRPWEFVKRAIRKITGVWVLALSSACLETPPSASFPAVNDDAYASDALESDAQRALNADASQTVPDRDRNDGFIEVVQTDVMVNDAESVDVSMTDRPDMMSSGCRADQICRPARAQNTPYFYRRTAIDEGENWMRDWCPTLSTPLAEDFFETPRGARHANPANAD